MNRNSIFLFLALILGSFSDEAVQVIFFLKVGNVEKIYLVSLLMLGAMIGSITANIYFSRLLQIFSLPAILIGSLIAQSGLILIASTIVNAWFYLVVTFLLGGLGGLLWSATLIAIPAITTHHAQLDTVNKYAHTIRNMGFVLGPILGGVLLEWLNLRYAMWLIGGFTLASALIFPFALRKLNLLPEQAKKTNYINGLRAIGGLWQTPTIRKALCPILLTVVLISTCSVLVIVYLTNGIQLNGEQFGIYISLFSLALTFSPLLFSTFFKKWGDATGACLAAALMGAGILILGSNSLYAIIVLAGILIGIGNGVQNTLLSAFMLKHISPENRPNQMPAYVLLLQSGAALGYLISLSVTAKAMPILFILFGSGAMIIGGVGGYLNRIR